jgi:hypothetical protein
MLLLRRNGVRNEQRERSFQFSGPQGRILFYIAWLLDHAATGRALCATSTCDGRTVKKQEGGDVQFRVQFLDVSVAVIKEMLIDTHSEHIGKVKFKIMNKGRCMSRRRGFASIECP